MWLFRKTDISIKQGPGATDMNIWVTGNMGVQQHCHFDLDIVRFGSVGGVS